MEYTVAIVGGGAGGMAAAITAAKLRLVCAFFLHRKIFYMRASAE